MLRGIPEDVRSEAGSLLVRSIPLDSAREPTFVHCNILWTEAPFTCQGPKDTSSFSQGLMHIYSDNIYLSLMADRRLGGRSVVQEQYLAFRQFLATTMRVLYGSDTVKLLLGIHK